MNFTKSFWIIISLYGYMCSTLMYTTALGVISNNWSRYVKLNEIADQLSSLLVNGELSEEFTSLQNDVSPRDDEMLQPLQNDVSHSDNEMLQPFIKREQENYLRAARPKFDRPTFVKNYTQFYNHLKKFLEYVSDLLKSNNVNIKWNKMNSLLKILPTEDINKLDVDNLRDLWQKLRNLITDITRNISARITTANLDDFYSKTFQLSIDMINLTFDLFKEAKEERNLSSGIGGANRVNNANRRLESIREVKSLIQDLKSSQ